MAAVLFDCVYTAHKTQKSKRYQDGRIKFNKDNHKISLYDMDVYFQIIFFSHSYLKALLKFIGQST